MSKKSRRSKSPKFLMVLDYLYRSKAFQSLDGNARSVYLELLSRFNGHNNGMIGLSSREAGAVVNKENDTGARALKMLLDRGFIAVASNSAFGQKRLSREWRLTHLPDDRTGHQATKEFMRYGSEKQKPVAQVRSIVAQVRHETPETGKTAIHSRADATVSPKSQVSQSRRCDTSRSTIPPAAGNGVQRGQPEQATGSTVHPPIEDGPAGVPQIEDDSSGLGDAERSLLRWMHGYRGMATHRTSQQNLSGVLTGEAIAVAAENLAGAGLIRIEKVKQSLIYSLLPAGRDPALLHDPDQFDLVNWLEGAPQ